MEMKCNRCKEEKAQENLSGMCKFCYVEWQIEEDLRKKEIAEGNDLKGLKDVGGFIGVSTEEVDSFLKKEHRRIEEMRGNKK